MSRGKFGKPIRMPDERRRDLAQAATFALSHCVLFPGERLQITVIRIDGDLQEIVVNETMESKL